jgi:hypothetical protein
MCIVLNCSIVFAPAAAAAANRAAGSQVEELNSAKAELAANLEQAAAEKEKLVPQLEQARWQNRQLEKKLEEAAAAKSEAEQVRCCGGSCRPDTYVQILIVVLWHCMLLVTCWHVAA